MIENASNRAGFMADRPNYGIGLQNRCTTTVLSRQKRVFPRDCLLSGQREKRGIRVGHRFKSAQGVAQYTPALFRKKIGPERGCRLNPALTTKPVQEVLMADAFPKAILPYLEGKIGELRIMRFWSKVDMRGPDECWLWQASLNTSGYGRFKMASYNTVAASRFALISTQRREPGGLYVLHHCDNPPCCNPHHLYFGTAADNTRDKVSRGRARTGDQRGESNPRAKLTEDQVALIVRRLKSGWNNKQIAADLPVTHSMVSLIRLGRMWRETAEQFGWHPRLPTPTPEAM